MMNNTERSAVLLAALLHDIGIFYQLGAANNPNMDDVDTIHLKAGQADCYNWNSRFLSNYESKIRTLLDGHYDAFEQALSQKPSNKPVNQVQAIVLEARTLAQGNNTNSSAAPNQLKGHFRMLSIFEGLLQSDIPFKFRMPVEPLSLTDAIFPQQAASFNQNPDFAKLWKGFEAEFNSIKATSADVFAETLLELLHKYGVTIPYTTAKLTDISLYDHIKSTAALAVCLHEVGQGASDDATNAQPFRLVGADISGIQSFIYDVAGTDAAKNLKGRSFYLQLLTDTVLQRLLDELQLTRANVVYASGGGFYLLAPNSAQVPVKLKELEKELSRKLFSKHQTNLFLAVSSVTVSTDQAQEGRINEAWQALTQQLNQKKRQRFKPQLLSEFGFFFEPSDLGGRHLRDVITGEEFAQGEKPEFLKNEKNKPVKPKTYQQVQLGKALRLADVAITTQGQKLGRWEEKSIEPLSLGYYHYFVSQEQVKEQKELLAKAGQKVRISVLNQPDFMQTDLPGSNSQFSMLLYGGNSFPEDAEGQPKLFDELTEGAGLKRLGYLRMDVDNLGQIFINGLKPEQRTFAGYSTLSRSLDWFFKGYLNTIWSSRPEFKTHTFILYSGGDDLFLVGRWDLILEMAEIIRQKFAAWTCHNPALGLSGGVAMVGGTFPIAKAAQMAEEAEKKAKSHWCEGREKDSFSVLGYALNWHQELPLVVKLKNQLAELITAEKDSLPRSILGKINVLFEQMQQQKRHQQNESWRWMIAYDFGRAKQRLKSESGKAFLDQIKNAVFAEEFEGQKIKSSYPFLELLQVAARWAELEIRKSVK